MTEQLPDHHKQWFHTMIDAAKNDRVALMIGTDKATGEARSIITLVNITPNGEYQFTPLGHLATTDNPFDAYNPAEEPENNETTS